MTGGIWGVGDCYKGRFSFNYKYPKQHEKDFYLIRAA